MTLIVMTGSYPRNLVLTDLMSIVGYDRDNLSFSSSQEVPQGALISYKQTIFGKFGQDRLNAIINNKYLPGPYGHYQVVIEGVDASGVFPLPSGTPFLNGPDSYEIQHNNKRYVIWYDTFQCSGTGFGYFVYDKDENKIPCPGPVILFNNLSYAYHYLVGDVAQDAAGQAIADENKLRDQYGLPLRNPSGPWGGCVGAP